MSLFQNKEWWTAKVGEAEEFDSHHLCISSIIPSLPDESQIIVGSLQGKLRIYAPHYAPFKMEDLLFEKDFQMPIIQIASGNFSFVNSNAVLCVLFFKKLNVIQFFLSKSSGGNLVPKLCYDANLPRNAYNMVHGHFGRGGDKDLICVQSCDGVLMIYEQENLISITQMNDFVIPSPIFWVEPINCFILQNSAYELECYRYSSIISGYHSNAQIKSINPDWGVNLGEMAMNITWVKRSETIHEIFVLCESMIFVVSPNGTLKSQKKLEFPACNFLVYESQKKENMKEFNGEKFKIFNMLVTSFTKHILVFEEFQLIWASRTNHVAHAINTACFDHQKGLIVSLNEDGWLQVEYLGAEPPSITYGLVDNQEIDYEKMDHQYNELVEKIGNAANGKTQKNNVFQESLKCSVSVVKEVVGLEINDEYMENAEVFFQDENGKFSRVRVRLILSYQGGRAENICIQFNLPHNLYIESNPIHLNSLSNGATPYSQEINIFCLNHEIPYTNKIDIIISYSDSLSNSQHKESKSCFCNFEIPNTLQFRVIPPIKQADYKLIFGINQEIDKLHSLFDEEIERSLNRDQILENPNAITFLLCNGVDCTILVGKNANKFRIQSSCFEGLYLMTQELVKKIKLKLGAETEIIYQESLPLQDFFMIIDEHFSTRKNLKEKKKVLDQKANQFRVIQKRMLTRFKDKNSTPLNNLDIIFNKTFEEIIATANEVEHYQLYLNDLSMKLRVVTELIIFLLKMRFKLKENTYELIRDILICPISDEENDFGWEELIYANITYILKIITKKDAEGAQVNIQPLEDLDKLKKHLTLLFDKVSKDGLNEINFSEKIEKIQPFKNKTNINKVK